MSSIVDNYLATWNAETAERDRLLEACWAADATYTDPMAAVSGRPSISAVIQAVHEQFPGFVFTLVGDADTHHDQLRFRWGLGPAGAEPVIIGFDVVVLDSAGLIADVRGFLDLVPA